MVDEAWRHEPITKGELYDILEVAYKESERHSDHVLSSMRGRLGSGALYQVARFSVAVTIDLPQEIMKALRKGTNG